MNRRVLHLRCTGALLGAESVVLELANHSKQFGYSAVVGVIHDERDNYPELADVAARWQLEFQVFTANRKLDPGCILNLRRYVAENDIDIIHTHGYREDLYALLAGTGKHLIATNHLWKKSNRLLRLYALIDSIVLTRFDHVVGVSRPILEEMSGIPFLGSRQLSMISNGVNIHRFNSVAESAIRTELKIPCDKILVTTVSSLTREKGHRYLFSALHKLKNQHTAFHSIIVGDGPLHDELALLAREFGLTDHITFLGRRDDIANILNGTDIFLLPSTKEGLPMSLLEAMACGTATIATDVGDVSMCVKDGETGILVAAADDNDLFQALVRLCNNPEYRKHLGTAASELVKSRFSAESMTREYCLLYDRILAD